MNTFKRPLKSLCVYCGSSLGASPLYANAAREMAAALVEDNIALVYGGGNVGLMGILADEVIRLGGEVTGIIPKGLMEKEVGHDGLTRLHIVKDMHERKALMAELSDAFIALPGGIGTLEELFEIFTWSQLGLHTKPIGLLNVEGFYNGLIDFIQHLVSERFLKAEQASLLLSEHTAGALLNRLKSFKPLHHEQTLDAVTARAII